MKDTSKHPELILAIIVAALLISGALVFFGLQQRSGHETETTIDEEQLIRRVKEEVFAELQNSEFLDQRVDAGIQRYIQKQQEAQQQARAEQERLANEKAKNVPHPSKIDDHIYGNPDAVISLIEYSDFECPFCKAFHSTAKKIVEAYDGKVNWVYRHYPLGFHNPAAQKEAEASECVTELGGNEAFWKYADLMYEHSALNGKGVPADKLVSLAEEIGLDGESFQACLDSGKYTDRVQKDFQEGSDSGISGTPGNILLNNQTGETRLKTGAQPFEALKAEIDQMLK
jgi:protein-disulfide isomerase